MKKQLFGTTISIFLFFTIWIMVQNGNIIMAESFGDRSFGSSTEVSQSEEREETDDSVIVSTTLVEESTAPLELASETTETSLTPGSAISPLALDAIGDVISLNNINYQITSITAGNLAVEVIPGDYVGTVVILDTVVSLNQQIYNVTGIGQDAFKNKSALVDCILPRTLNYIGSGAFEGCTLLRSINLPIKVEQIGDYAFRGCTNLYWVKLSTYLLKIGQQAFENCSKLENIYFPESLVELGSEAFKNCVLLNSIHITNNVQLLGTDWFKGCVRLYRITVGANNAYLALQNGVVYNKTITSLVWISPKRAGVFTLPETVTTLPEAAFQGCTDLTTIIISSNVGQIKTKTFFGCTSLNQVRFQSAGAPSFEIDIFSSDMTVTVCVPETSNASYQTALDGKVDWSKIDIANCPPITPTPTPSPTPSFTPTPTSTPTPSPTVTPTPSPTPKPTDLAETFVTGLYQKILGRTPDKEGLANWTAKLKSRSITGARVVDLFLESNEFKNKNLNNSDYVELLYTAILGRKSDNQGKINWANLLNNGVTRRYIANQFYGSNEFIQDCKSYGIEAGILVLQDVLEKNIGATMFVHRIYSKALTRQPDLAGYRDWVGKIVFKQQSPEQVAENFFSSSEFINKKLDNTAYVKVLYRTFLDREADAHGLNDWVSQLNSGQSRNSVLKGFSQSREFKVIMAKYGL